MKTQNQHPNSKAAMKRTAERIVYESRTQIQHLHWKQEVVPYQQAQQQHHRFPKRWRDDKTSQHVSWNQTLEGLYKSGLPRRSEQAHRWPLITAPKGRLRWWRRREASAPPSKRLHLNDFKQLKKQRENTYYNTSQSITFICYFLDMNYTSLSAI